MMELALFNSSVSSFEIGDRYGLDWLGKEAWDDISRSFCGFPQGMDSIKEECALKKKKKQKKSSLPWLFLKVVHHVFSRVYFYLCFCFSSLLLPNLL